MTSASRRIAQIVAALLLTAPVALAQPARAETDSQPGAEPGEPAVADRAAPDADDDGGNRGGDDGDDGGDDPSDDPSDDDRAAPDPPPKPRRVRKPAPKIDLSKRLDKSEDRVAGGLHWRIKAGSSAVHVWIPPGYDRKTAGTVVYVHGYYTDADGAWKGHALARQFKASGQNAMFIVPDAPGGNGESVVWPALADLRKAVTRANIRLPDGPTIVLGHSGGFRTVMQWVDHKVVAQVILLDALYGGNKAFDEFIATGKRARHHKLIVIGSDTAEASAAFAKKYPFAVVRDKMPGKLGGFSRREKTAKLLYVRSQFGHMQIVTSRKVIPLLLRLTPLRHL